MKKIQDFKSFSRIYEAEAGQTDKKVSEFENLIHLVLANYFDCYKKMASLTVEPYDSKIMGDYDQLAKQGSVGGFNQILSKVTAKAKPEAAAAAKELGSAGRQFILVLNKINTLMPNSKDAIKEVVQNYITKAKENLVKASQENDAKAAADQVKNESQDFGFDLVLESKKGDLKDISKQITAVSSTLADMEAIPFMKNSVTPLRGELQQIESAVAKLFGAKNKDISKDVIAGYSEKLNQMLTGLTTKQEELAKQNEVTKEAALDFTKATEALRKASEAYSKYQDLQIKKKEEGDIKTKKDEFIKKFTEEFNKLGWDGKTLTKADLKGKKNEALGNIQTLISRKLGGKIEGSESFNKFSKGKFSGDGYFGDITDKVIRGLKAGLGMTDKSSDITEELIDRVLSLKESQNFEGILKSFDSFSSVNERKNYPDQKFDLKKFLEIADGKKPEENKKEEPAK